MEYIPTLVQEFKLSATTNAVCVAVVKFTIDQFDLYFPASSPAPVKLARQIVSLKRAYGVMNDAYAEQQKRAETAGIKARDDEGDQLLYGVKGMLEGAIRMTYDQVRQQQAQMLWDDYRKYRIDPTENMISEWSKVQQFCEEYLASQELQQAGVTLAVDGAIRRLAVLADEIRELMTERNAATPDQGAMKAAREAVYPEYRTAILLLNAFAATSDDVHQYDALIRALNQNLNYVRQHAMAGGSGSSGNNPTPTPSPEPDPQPDPEPDPEPAAKHTLTTVLMGDGSSTVKDDDGQLITGQMQIAAGTALHIEVEPVPGGTPTAKLNSDYFELTPTDGIYKATVQMPDRDSTLMIDSGTNEN